MSALKEARTLRRSPYMLSSTDTLAAWTAEAGRLLQSGAGRTLGRLVALDYLGAHGTLNFPDTFGARSAHDTPEAQSSQGSSAAGCPDAKWVTPLDRFGSNVSRWTVFESHVCAWLLASLAPALLMTALTVWPARRLHSRVYFAAALQGLVEERHPGTEYLAEHEGLRAMLVEMCLGRGPAIEFAEDELGPDHPDRQAGLHPYERAAGTNPADINLSGENPDEPCDTAAESSEDPDADPDAEPCSEPGSGSYGASAAESADAPAGGTDADRAAASAPHAGSDTSPNTPSTAKTHRKSARGASGVGEAA